MESSDYEVTLTLREQQLLADLERVATESDPRLDILLRTARRSRKPSSPLQQFVIAVGALLAATVLMLGTFTRLLGVAILAVLLQTGTLALGVRGWARLRQGGYWRDHPTSRRRGWVALYLATAGLVAAGAAVGFAVVADQSTGQAGVSCYAQARFDAHRLEISPPAGASAVGACQTAWAFGRVDGRRAVADPALTACVLPDGQVGVFPDPLGTVCGRLGLAAVSRPSVNISARSHDGTFQPTRAVPQPLKSAS